MSNAPVRLIPFDQSRVEVHGPMEADMRTRGSALTELSVGFVHFPETAKANLYTMPYEEVVYVIDGEFSVECDGVTVTAGPGEVLTIEKGAAVYLSGTAGTRALYALSPAAALEAVAHH